MEPRKILTLSIFVLLLGISLMIFSAWSVIFLGEKMTLRGQFIALENCKGVVQGILITGYGNTTNSSCDNAAMYDGKIVEVTGYVYKHECEKEEECFGGPYMKDIEEIKIVE